METPCPQNNSLESLTGEGDIHSNPPNLLLNSKKTGLGDAGLDMVKASKCGSLTAGDGQILDYLTRAVLMQWRSGFS